MPTRRSCSGGLGWGGLGGAVCALHVLAARWPVPALLSTVAFAVLQVIRLTLPWCLLLPCRSRLLVAAFHAQPAELAPADVTSYCAASTAAARALATLVQPAMAAKASLKRSRSASGSSSSGSAPSGSAAAAAAGKPAQKTASTAPRKAPV